MAMVDVDTIAIYGWTLADWLGPKVGGHLVHILHSSNEPGELSRNGRAMMTAP